ASLIAVVGVEDPQRLSGPQVICVHPIQRTALIDHSVCDQGVSDETVRARNIGIPGQSQPLYVRVVDLLERAVELLFIAITIQPPLAGLIIARARHQRARARQANENRDAECNYTSSV